MILRDHTLFLTSTMGLSQIQKRCRSVDPGLQADQRCQGNWLLPADEIAMKSGQNWGATNP